MSGSTLYKPESGDYPFLCHHEECQRPFFRKTSLTNHLKAHLNVKSRSIKRYRLARERRLRQIAAAAVMESKADEATDNKKPTNKTFNGAVVEPRDDSHPARDMKPAGAITAVPGPINPVVTKTQAQDLLVMTIVEELQKNAEDSEPGKSSSVSGLEMNENQKMDVSAGNPILDFIDPLELFSSPINQEPLATPPIMDEDLAILPFDEDPSIAPESEVDILLGLYPGPSFMNLEITVPGVNVGSKTPGDEAGSPPQHESGPKDFTSVPSGNDQ